MNPGIPLFSMWPENDFSLGGHFFVTKMSCFRTNEQSSLGTWKIFFLWQLSTQLAGFTTYIYLSTMCAYTFFSREWSMLYAYTVFSKDTHHFHRGKTTWDVSMVPLVVVHGHIFMPSASLRCYGRWKRVFQIRVLWLSPVPIWDVQWKHAKKERFHWNVHTCSYHQDHLIDGLLGTWPLFFWYFGKNWTERAEQQHAVCVCVPSWDLHKCLSF